MLFIEPFSEALHHSSASSLRCKGKCGQKADVARCRPKSLCVAGGCFSPPASGLAEGFHDDSHLPWREDAVAGQVARFAQAFHHPGVLPHPPAQVGHRRLYFRRVGEVEPGQFPFRVGSDCGNWFVPDCEVLVNDTCFSFSFDVNGAKIRGAACAAKPVER